jgi:hypothetical protein
MATCLEKLVRANRWRIRTGKMASSEIDGWNGAFQVPLEGELWYVMISDREGWRHLSIRNSQKKALPSWQVMTRVKACFFGDDDWVVQFIPPRAEYVNDCQWVLHLWQPVDAVLPTPHVALV